MLVKALVFTVSADGTLGAVVSGVVLVASVVDCPEVLPAASLAATV
jgi:hypothetical protein